MYPEIMRKGPGYLNVIHVKIVNGVGLFGATYGTEDLRVGTISVVQVLNHICVFEHLGSGLINLARKIRRINAFLDNRFSHESSADYRHGVVERSREQPAKSSKPPLRWSSMCIGEPRPPLRVSMRLLTHRKVSLQWASGWQNGTEMFSKKGDGKAKALKRIESQPCGRVALVTASNAGLGYTSVLELVRQGAKVYMALRTSFAADVAIALLKAAVPATPVGFLAFDLASLRVAKATADEFLERDAPGYTGFQRGGVAILAEGGWFWQMEQPCELKAGGIELQACNGTDAHVHVTGSSEGHRTAQGPEFSGFKACSTAMNRYGNSKLSGSGGPIYALAVDGDCCLSEQWLAGDTYMDAPQRPNECPELKNPQTRVLFTNELQCRLAGTGIYCLSVHPGLVATNIYRGTHTRILPVARALLLPREIRVFKPRTGRADATTTVEVEERDLRAAYLTPNAQFCPPHTTLLDPNCAAARHHIMELEGESLYAKLEGWHEDALILDRKKRSPSSPTTDDIQTSSKVGRLRTSSCRAEGKATKGLHGRRSGSRRNVTAPRRNFEAQADDFSEQLCVDSTRHFRLSGVSRSKAPAAALLAACKLQRRQKIVLEGNAVHFRRNRVVAASIRHLFGVADREFETLRLLKLSVALKQLSSTPHRPYGDKTLKTRLENSLNYQQTPACLHNSRLKRENTTLPARYYDSPTLPGCSNTTPTLSVTTFRTHRTPTPPVALSGDVFAKHYRIEGGPSAAHVIDEGVEGRHTPASERYTKEEWRPLAEALRFTGEPSWYLELSLGRDVPSYRHFGIQYLQYNAIYSDPHLWAHFLWSPFTTVRPDVRRPQYTRLLSSATPESPRLEPLFFFLQKLSLAYPRRAEPLPASLPPNASNMRAGATLTSTHSLANLLSGPSRCPPETLPSGLVDVHRPDVSISSSRSPSVPRSARQSRLHVSARNVKMRHFFKTHPNRSWVTQVQGRFVEARFQRNVSGQDGRQE
ncbi:hypothetical protein B0H14DRAFT_2603378 [Mycena olivaceomarginata]|nr:hypothetical protein B0H14DRAFT_2603378 [Mycena olivaceomarginata]